MDTKPRKERDFVVWVKGKRISTAATVRAAYKLDAIFIFARNLGLKTIQCDAVLAKAEARV